MKAEPARSGYKGTAAQTNQHANEWNTEIATKKKKRKTR